MATVFRCDLIVRNALIFDGIGASRALHPRAQTMVEAGSRLRLRLERVDRNLRAGCRRCSIRR
jgi:hypothetical protein